MTNLDSCPLCKFPVNFHEEPGECSGCHLIHCTGCGMFADLSNSADPANECQTLEELREKIAPIWNKRLQ